MIHESIQSITERRVIIARYIDRLEGTVEAIRVKRLELKQPPVLRRTLISIPGRLERAAAVDNIRVVRDYRERSRREGYRYVLLLLKSPLEA